MNIEKANSSVTALVNNNNTALKQAESIKRSAVQNNQNVSNQSHTGTLIRKDEIEVIVESFNDFIDPLRTNLKFVFHEQLNEYYVAVVNPLTNEIVKEIPPKKMLDMYAAMAEFMGILIDEKI